MVLIAALSILVTGEFVAYDEFDGRTAGFKNAWTEGQEESGKWVTTQGNSWRGLTHPVSNRTIWYAVTMRMRDPIQGYASVVPAKSASSQFSELGFNSAYGKDFGMWTASPHLTFGPLESTVEQTFLQRYDLADGVWSAWSLKGDGREGVGSIPRLVKDAPLSATELSHIYLTKGSNQTLEIERLAIATSAEAALTPVEKGTVVVQVAPNPPRPVNPSFEALRASVRTGDRIAFFGDSITWQAGHLDILERELRGKHVTILRRGINGAKSADVVNGVKNLFNQTQRPFREVLMTDKPTLAVVMVGINDAWRPAVPDPEAEYERQLKLLAKDAAQEGVRLLICSTTAIEPDKVNPDFSGTLAKLRTVAQSTGSVLAPRRSYCEVYGAFTRAKSSISLTYDGVHLSQAGNQLLAETLAGGIARALSAPDLVPGGIAVPQPAKTWMSGQKITPTSFLVTSTPQLTTQAATLQLLLGSPARGALPVRLGLSNTLAKEAYTIKLSKSAIQVTGGSPQAVSWASATFCQMRQGGLFEGQIEDHPAKPFRGLLLDIARQWHSIATIKDVIQLCSLYKINFLQLHLTDDQSFTFPSTAYPELATAGRSYTLKELKELQGFATARGVTIIPELEMPGHGAQLVSKRPDLFRAHEKHHATVNFAKPESLLALETLVNEVIDAFPSSPFIHIGGDEADLTYVHENPDFQAAFKREGVADAQELYRTLLNRMNKLIRARKKTMLVWEGFGPGGKTPIDKSIVVMNFESAYFAPDQMAAAGHTMINASWRPLYVVNDRNWSPEEIYGWNDHFWNHFVDGFPSSGGMQVDPNGKILGGIMCAWEQPESKEIESLRQRLPAMAERLWNPGLRVPYRHFEQRMRQADAVLTGWLRNTR